MPEALRPSSFGWLRVLCAAGVALAALAWAPDAAAYSWMIKHGYGACGTCHADPSGGELLTRYGRAQSDLILRMRYGKDTVSAAAGEDNAQPSDSDFDSFDSFDDDFTVDEPEPKKPEPKPKTTEPAGPAATSGFLWGLVPLPDFLLLGGAYRHLTVYEPSEGDISTFPMQIDLYGQVRFASVRAGGSLGLAKVEAGSPHARKAQVTTNQGDELNLISRTHWLGFDASPDLVVRAGRLNLPFGVRIPEHVMWVREATLTDRESDQQHGVAVAYSGDRFRGELMAIAGNYQVNPDRYRERGYSAFVEMLVADQMAVGVSSLVTRADADLSTLQEETTWRQAHGALGRLTLAKPLVLLVEADALLKSGSDLGYVGMLQADYELVQGLHFMATGEIMDQGFRSDLGLPRVAGAGEPRFGGWLSVDWFFLPGLEARIDAVVRQDAPFTLLSQLHISL